MSLGQTMISAAFFVLLTLAVFSANTMILENTKYYLQEEAIEQASNFANALLGEIVKKKFDSQVTLDEGAMLQVLTINTICLGQLDIGLGPVQHFLTRPLLWALVQPLKIM